MTQTRRPLLESAGGAPSLSSDGFGVLRGSIDERVEAFEDVTASMVGDSIFTRARNLERQFGLTQVWLKFEGDNPTGTQKDRIAFAQTADALRKGRTTVTVATCGNYGVAVALACRYAGLACVVVIPAGNHSKRTIEMEALGATIVRWPGMYEDAVDRSTELSAQPGWYDANPGGHNERVQIDGYATIAVEIQERLREAPAMVAVPVSNGTTLAGVHKGFVGLHRRGLTSRVPKMIGGSAWRKNPIVVAFRQGLDTCPMLVPESIRETAVNEPLINWRSIDGDVALSSIRSTGGHAGDATDKRMRTMSRFLRDHQGLHVLPASTAGLIALVDLHASRPLPPDRYVVVLTGRNS